MTEFVITPDQVLQLQRSIRSVGLTNEEFECLSKADTLRALLPFLLRRAKIAPYCSFSPWKHIEISNRFKKGTNAVKALQGVGVKIGPLSYLPLEAVSNIDFSEERYELFQVYLSDLGFSTRVPYKVAEKRARVLEIHDGTVAPSLAIELLLQNVLSISVANFSYRVFSQPVPPTDLLGETVFFIQNNSLEEVQDGQLFTKNNPVCIAWPLNYDEDYIEEHQTLIFSRKVGSPLGQEPPRARTGMWPIPLVGGKLLPKD